MSFAHKIKRGIGEILRYFPAKVSVKTPVLYGEMLKGRTALITGGTGGIGLEISRAFLRNGADVIITGRNEAKIQERCKALQDEFPSSNIYGGVLDNCNIDGMDSQLSDIFSKTEKKIDILVNNAGVLSKNDFGSATEDDYDKVMDTDLKGAYFITQIVAEYMKRNKVQGNILNISSSSSIRPATSSYHLAKWGIRGLTKGLAKELIPFGIVVNGLAPGPTATSMLTANNNINRPSAPNGRFSTPEEIANLAVVLVSDISRTVVGDTIFASGGCGLLTYDDWN